MQLDAVVVGGGFAGLAAATYLARGRRSVAIVDAGRPRNRFAAESHGFLGQDGCKPREILAVARGQVLAYPSVRFIGGEVERASANDDGFEISCKDGDLLSARKLILAFGVSDNLPNLPGLNERWGRSVLHCPYCHGFEFSDRRLGVLFTSAMSVHQAMLIAEWGPTTLYLNGHLGFSAEALAQLEARGVEVAPDRIAALEGEGGDLSAIRFADGQQARIDALYLAPQLSFNSPLAEQLGCALDESPLGPMVRTSADKQTTVAGVYAAGDIARAPHSVSWAVADGVTAGIAAHRALVFPDA